MKKNRNILPIMFCLTVFIYGCKKENNNMGVLPPVTMEGKNTFGFMLDNTVWLPGKKWNSFYSAQRKQLCIQYDKGTGNLYLRSTRDGITHSNIDNLFISLKGIKDQQVYSLTQEHVIDISMSINESEEFYFNQYVNSGVFIVHRLDTINNIISGEFEIELIEREISTNKKKIYEGRFDLQMDYCTRN